MVGWRGSRKVGGEGREGTDRNIIPTSFPSYKSGRRRRSGTSPSRTLSQNLHKRSCYAPLNVLRYLCSRWHLRGARKKKPPASSHLLTRLLCAMPANLSSNSCSRILSVSYFLLLFFSSFFFLSLRRIVAGSSFFNIAGVRLIIEGITLRHWMPPAGHDSLFNNETPWKSILPLWMNVASAFHIIELPVCIIN